MSETDDIASAGTSRKSTTGTWKSRGVESSMDGAVEEREEEEEREDSDREYEEAGGMDD